MRNGVGLQLVEQVPDHVRQTPGALTDVGEGGSRFIEIRHRCVQEFERRLGVRRGAHQRLIELVRDRARQHAERRHLSEQRNLLLKVAGLRFGFPERLRREPLLGAIANQGEQESRRTAGDPRFVHALLFLRPPPCIPGC